MVELIHRGTTTGQLSGQLFINSKGRDETGQGSLDPSHCPDGETIQTNKAGTRI